MKKIKFLLAGLVLLAVTAAPLPTRADVNNFMIDSFVSDQTLSRDDPNGTLRIVETIDLTFTDNNHGILRAIPRDYKGHPLKMKINQVSSATGAPAQYTTYGSNGNTVIKIGDPDKTVTGKQQYKIDYTLQNVISFYDNHNELYWDVNGDQWPQMFQQVRVNVHLPDDLKQAASPECFTGGYGEKADSCSISKTKDGFTATSTAVLSPYENLTYVAAFEKGFFTPHKWYEQITDHQKGLILFAAPILIVGGGSVLYWWRRGRDASGKGIIVPQYEPPANLKPAEVSAIDRFKMDNKAITAMIIDLAVRKYIKIIETKKDRLLRKDKLQYTLAQVNGDTSQLNANEIKLIQALFGNKGAGASVEVSSKANKLYKTAQEIREKVETDLTNAGYFRTKPGKSGAWLGAILVIIFVSVVWFAKPLGLTLVAGLVGSWLIVFFVLRSMPARTKLGVEAKEHIEGLRLYLETAEKDRLEKLQAPNAAYSANHSEPVKTVELFEKLLPYAMVLGVEKQWAKQFESLYTTPPEWYSGNWSTFNAYYLAASLNDGVGSAVNAAFSPPSSSGSSGSGGGGFSGGGGGGGGGGGW